MAQVSKISRAGLSRQVAQYTELKREAERIEMRLRELRIPIEEATLMRGGRVELAEATVTVTECERESFSLSKAREGLDEKTLRLIGEYVTKSTYNRLVIK